MSVEIENVERLRLLTELWVAWCNCGGPQPSYYNARLAEHSVDCAFFQTVSSPVDDESDILSDHA